MYFFQFWYFGLVDFQLLLVTTGYDQKVAAELSSIPPYIHFLFASF